LSLVAGLLHLWKMPEHFEAWWGYGGFSLLTAITQMVYAPFLLRWPNRTVMLLGIAGNSAIVLLYLLVWAVGVFLLGPGAGEGAHVGLIDACATSSAAAIVVALAALVALGSARKRTTPVGLFFSAILLLIAHAPHLLLLLLALL